MKAIADKTNNRQHNIFVRQKENPRVSRIVDQNQFTRNMMKGVYTTRIFPIDALSYDSTQKPN